jgi:hypothetical protein
MKLDYAPEARIVNAELAGDVGHGYVRGHAHHKSFKQQRKATSRTRPG